MFVLCASAMPIATKINAKREPLRLDAAVAAAVLPVGIAADIVAAAASVHGVVWVAVALSFAIAAVTEALY